MPSFTFSIDITAEKTSGKFVDKDTMVEQLEEQLNDIASSLDMTFDEAEYEITDVVVDYIPPTPKGKKKAS